ncbi:MAG: UbiA family prenyltransferase [Chloroflexi bacterium]|nr:UbiA family prenyltransferase [Chloroflexota bacterium]
MTKLITDAIWVARRSEKVWSGLAAKLRAYWALVKSRQTLLLLATGVAGYLSARPDGVTGTTISLILLGLFAAISGTTALNMVIDRDIDALMERTAWRPLPAGTMTPTAAIIFGGGLVTLGLGIAFWTDWLFGLVIAAGTAIDLIVYTLWLKRRSAWAIIFGGISGGMPILAGRALVVGRVDGLGLLLALSVLLWIPSHIVTFSIKYAGDYRRAGVPTWPGVYGFDSARRLIAKADGLRAATLIAVGWLLDISPYSLALLTMSGVVTLALSLAAMVRPSEKINYRLFKFASVHMLVSMVLITWGALA